MNRRLAGIILGIVLVLLIPFIVMQFTNEVNWAKFDFFVAGFLLIATGLLCELLTRKAAKLWHRMAICLAIIAALLLLWAELAVGILGTPIGGT